MNKEQAMAAFLELHLSLLKQEKKTSQLALPADILSVAEIERKPDANPPRWSELFLKGNKLIDSQCHFKFFGLYRT